MVTDASVIHDGPNVTSLTYYPGHKTKQNVSFHDGLNVTSWSVPVEISIGSASLQLNVTNPSTSQWVKPDKSICVTNSYHGPNVIIMIKLSKFIVQLR